MSSHTQSGRTHAKGADRVDPPVAVYHIPVRNDEERRRRMGSLVNVVDHRAFRLLRIFREGTLVGVKPCEGDPGMSAEYVTAVARLLRDRRASAFVCDTSNRHRDVRTDGVKHIVAAYERGLTCAADVPYVMLDGLDGDRELTNREDKRVPPGIFLAGELGVPAGLVLVSCPRPHPLAGVAGALVNMGTGLAARRGKIRQHAMAPPRVNTVKCHTCRQCLRVCPVGAIHMAGKHVEIDAARCINCGKCVEIAHFGGIAYAWDATPEHYRAAVSAYASAARAVLNDRVVCIHVLMDAPAPAGKLFGILASRDPVAADAAAIDLLGQAGLLGASDGGLAKALVDAAATAGAGSLRYRLETIAF